MMIKMENERLEAHLDGLVVNGLIRKIEDAAGGFFLLTPDTMRHLNNMPAKELEDEVICFVMYKLVGGSPLREEDITAYVNTILHLYNAETKLRKSGELPAGL